MLFRSPLWLALPRDWALLDNGLCFSSTHPFSCYHLLPYHSIIPAAKLFASILLFILLPMVLVRSLVLSLIHLQASMSHLFSLGHPKPICFPWASSALFLTLHSHGLLLNSLDFLGPITLSLILRVHGFAINSLLFCFHYFGPVAAHSHFSTSYTAHDLLFLSFRTPLSPFTSSRPICLSHRPVIHYSCCLGLMDFLSICQLFSAHVAGILLSTWASKMAINKHLQLIFSRRWKNSSMY